MLPPLPKNTLEWASLTARTKYTGKLDISVEPEVQRQCRVD